MCYVATSTLMFHASRRHINHTWASAQPKPHTRNMSMSTRDLIAEAPPTCILRKEDRGREWTPLPRKRDGIAWRADDCSLEAATKWGVSLEWSICVLSTSILTPNTQHTLKLTPETTCRCQPAR